ncbi:MAG: maltose ABC transporter permease MalG, partial [Myxococcota bacterium]
MPIVTGKSHRWRVFGAHAGLIAFILVTVFPMLVIISISLRKGNVSGGDIIPSLDQLSLEHWYLALGIPYTFEDGTVEQPPFPVLLWLWNSIKVAVVSAALILLFSTTSAYAFSRLKFRGKAAILNSILLLQMFPAVLALVAIYTIFETLGDYVPWLGLNTHAGVILAYVGGISL